MSEPKVTETERRTYLNHIRRLEARNAVLGQMLAQERLARQNAYAWYAKRLKSRFFGMMDLMLMHGGKLGLLALAILHLERVKK